MFGRVDAIVAAGQHGNGAAAEARTMGGGVDAARQARDGGKARGDEIAHESLGETHARCGGVARTDDGDHRPVERRRSAAHGEQRRGVVDHLQPARILRLPQSHEADAERLRRRELALGVRAGMDAGRPSRAATPGEIGQRRQCRARAAVMVDERAERARADMVGADQPKPIEPLLVAQPHALVRSARGHSHWSALLTQICL